LRAVPRPGRGPWVDDAEPDCHRHGRACNTFARWHRARNTPSPDRHRFFALIHLIANGDIASFIFFGAIEATALAGTVSIDAKQRRALDPAWQSFAAQTSILPLAAIAIGRTTLNLSKIVPWRWAAAILIYVLPGGHSHIFGVSPFQG
jgi:uncharacterized membrane protein